MTELVLLNVSGEDKPGLTASITELLSNFDIDILDIGQAVIHNYLTLGILISIPDNLPASSEQTGSTGSRSIVSSRKSFILEEVASQAEKLAIKVKMTPISEHEYEEWVTHQGHSRFILTLLARKIKADHIAQVSKVVASNGLNIDAIVRLSGRVPLLPVEDMPAENRVKACVEFALKGEPDDAKAFRAQLMQVCTDLDIDIAVQEDSIFRRNRRLVAFDMDSTLITTEVIDELAILAGVGEQVKQVTEQAMLGELDFKESLRKRVSLLKGLPETSLKQVAENLPLTEGVEHLFQTLNKLGYKTAILSGGFTYFAEHLQQKLGINYVHANNLEIVAGKLTGKVIEPIVDADRKAELLKDLADSENISLEQTIAVGDGANDLMMLATAGLGIAFHAKPIVKKNAEQSISTLGLDSILYLMGIRDREAHKLIGN